MTSSHLRRFIIAVGFLFPSSALAAVTVTPLFSDHMVIQRDVDVPVWGEAKAGEKVTVEFLDRKISATADEKGEWSLKFPAMKATGDAASMTIRGEDEKQKLVLNDVLVGDVWICSGQSNMQWRVKDAKDAAREIEEAKFPNIRAFRVPLVTSTRPTKELHGEWEVCSPTTVSDFSAVGYFFGREIHQRERVPMGLIMNPWGGKPAESFTSAETLAADPDFAPILERKRRPSTQMAEQAKQSFERDKAAWEKKYVRQDEGNQGFGNGWANADADESDWKPMKLPQHWEETGLKIDGAVWFRRTIEIPSAWEGKELSLSLGGIDDTDTTYFNGKEIGKTEGALAVMVQRQYAVPAELVKAGKAVIAVRVFDMLSDGGFYGPGTAMKLGRKEDESAAKKIALDGEWKYKVEKAIEQPASIATRPAPSPVENSPFLASNIYNAMVYPLVPYAIKGVIWYQGESNADRAEQYRKLFPAMIRDWRNQWKQGEFPFLFVQLANYDKKGRPDQPADSAWAELREAQTMTLVASPNTAMAVTIDIGEGMNIHPKNKQDVGKRLALAAEKVAYGKGDIEYSGPIYQLMKVEDGKVRLSFDHAKGLKTRDGQPPRGFQIAGKDQKWVWADAKIDGRDVIVWSGAVKKPAAVRYGWGNDPVTSLYNEADLPASPFRTDDWPMITAGKR